MNKIVSSRFKILILLPNILLSNECFYWLVLEDNFLNFKLVDFYSFAILTSPKDSNLSFRNLTSEPGFFFSLKVFLPLLKSTLHNSHLTSKSFTKNTCDDVQGILFDRSLAFHWPSLCSSALTLSASLRPTKLSWHRRNSISFHCLASIWPSVCKDVFNSEDCFSILFFPYQSYEWFKNSWRGVFHLLKSDVQHQVHLSLDVWCLSRLQFTFEQHYLHV